MLSRAGVGKCLGRGVSLLVEHLLGHVCMERSGQMKFFGSKCW